METIENPCVLGDRREPRREESIARDLVGPCLYGDPISIPDPPDFALCRDGEVIGWAEVTTAVDADRLALDDWLLGNDVSFTYDQLTHDWIVIPHKTAKLDKLDPDALVELSWTGKPSTPKNGAL